MTAGSGTDWASEHRDGHVAEADGTVLERRGIPHAKENFSALVDPLRERRHA